MKRNEEKARKSEYDLGLIRDRMEEMEQDLLNRLKELENAMKAQGLGDPSKISEMWKNLEERI